MPLWATQRSYSYRSVMLPVWRPVVEPICRAACPALPVQLWSQQLCLAPCAAAPTQPAGPWATEIAKRKSRCGNIDSYAEHSDAIFGNELNVSLTEISASQHLKTRGRDRPAQRNIRKPKPHQFFWYRAETQNTVISGPLPSCTSGPSG